MLNIACVVGLSILLFLCLYLGFRTGLKLGMRACKGVEPPPIKSPIQIIHEAKERKEAEQEAEEEKDIWQQIEECDGYTEEERKRVYKGGDKG